MGYSAGFVGIIFSDAKVIQINNSRIIVFLLTTMFGTNFKLTLRVGHVRPENQQVSEVVPEGKKQVAHL